MLTLQELLDQTESPTARLGAARALLDLEATFPLAQFERAAAKLQQPLVANPYAAGSSFLRFVITIEGK